MPTSKVFGHIGFAIFVAGLSIVAWMILDLLIASPLEEPRPIGQSFVLIWMGSFLTLLVKEAVDAIKALPW